jgi:ATP-dependent RNA helicase DDX24/MAK5
MEWEDCVENPELISTLRSNGFEKPTPIQAASLKHTVKYIKDVILAAQTGSGKTLCFGIPIVHTAIPAQGLQALVITPTRELALQISEHIQAINYKKLNVMCLIGGLSSQKQERLFKRNPEVLIATPGRLWEFIHDLQNDYARSVAFVKMLVIDEADRMVEMGHFKELHSILNYIYNPSAVPKDIIEPAGNGMIQDINFGYELMLDPSEFSLNSSSFKDLLKEGEVEARPNLKADTEKVKRQTILVSATLTMEEEARLTSKRKKKLKKKGLSDNRLELLMSKIKFKGKPEIIDLTQDKLRPEELKEAKILCTDDQKDAFLLYFLKEHKGEPTIVFTNSISCTRRVVAILKELKIAAFCLDGKMQQRQRLKRVEQ